MKRRTFLVGSGAALTVGVAGCTGDDGGDDGNGGDTPTETSTPDDSPGATETPTATETDQPTATDEPGDGPAFGDAVQPATSFAFSGEFEDSTMEGQGTMEGRFHDENSYMAFTFEDQTVEMYNVDGTSYMVSGGQCFENPSQDAQPDDPGQDPGEWDEDVADYSDLQPDGTTTVNGEQAYYWSLDQTGEEVTYYVSVSSGQLLRIELPTGYINYHSWGTADPIEPPDMECTSFPG